MMSALFLSKTVSTKETFSDKMMNKLQSIYQPLLRKALQLKYIIVSAIVILFAV